MTNLKVSPALYIWRKLIKVIPTPHPNQILIHKPTRIRIVVPEEVVMQPRFTVAILVLQAEGLVSSSRYVRLTLQFAPSVIIAKPNQIAFVIGHLSRDADLVAVEVVGLLSVFAVFGCPVTDLRERFVGILVGVDISIHAVRVDFLKQMAAIPNEAGVVF